MGSLSCYEVGHARGSHSVSDPALRCNLFVEFRQSLVLGNYPPAPFPLEDSHLLQLRSTGLQAANRLS